MMKRIAELIADVLAPALCLIAIAPGLAVPAASQILQPTLSVDGNPLVTSRPVTRIGQEWFLPLIPIADAVGVEISMSADGQELRARHRNGTEVVYDHRTGQIRQGYVLAGQLKNYRQIQFVGPREDLLFPLDGVVVLLGVDIEEDSQHAVLRVQSAGRGQQGAAAVTPALALTALNYNYGLTTNTEDYSQAIQLAGNGLSHNVRLSGNLLLSRYPGQRPLNFNQGTLHLDLPEDRKLVVGDQGTYSGLEALTNMVRGIGLDEPVKGYRINLYGGQSTSAVFGSLGGSFARFDTGIAGVSLNRKSRSEEISLAGLHFSGAARTGTAFGVAYGRLSRRNLFKSQVLAGHFSGLSPASGSTDFALAPAEDGMQIVPGANGNLTASRGGLLAGDAGRGFSAALPDSDVDGPAFGLTLTDTFTPFRQLSLSGQLNRYGRNFLTPRDDPRFNGQSSEALSVVLRPSRHTSLTAGMTRRTYLFGDRASLSSHNLGAQATLPGRYPLQFGVFASAQRDSVSPQYHTSLTQFSFVVPSFGRYSAYAYFTEMGFGDVRAHHLNAVFAVDLKDRGRLTLNDQLQWGTSHRYGVDWYLDMPGRRAYLRLGLDRIASEGDTAGFSPLAGIRVPLPHGHTLEFIYSSDRNTRTLRVEIGGRLIEEHDAAGRAPGSGSIVSSAPVAGRVFLDEDLNGTFEEGRDRPVPEVQVRLDGTQLAVTDAQGLFRFDQVEPGAHSVRAGLEGLPADLIFADASERTMAVLPFRVNVLNFSVVRTGRISGKVNYLDYRGDPEHPVARPLPDARVTAGPQYDAWSELNGRFLIGDLPPGTYELKLDSETLPAGYVPTPSSIQAAVKPGETLDRADFLLVIPPKPVVQKVLPPQPADASAAATAASVEKARLVEGPETGGKPAQDPKPSPVASAPKPAEQPEASQKPAPGTAELPARPVAPAGTAISPNAASNAPDPAAKPFRVQTYSSQVLGEVARRAGILRKAGVACRIVPAEIPGRGTWYRIRLGGFSTREEAVSAGESLVARGLAETYWVVQ